ncbi:hypothetical protein N1Z87_006947, partial [Pseudomonas aeruginosa]
MNELRKITQKEIQYKDKYLSYTKSMLHLPIFCVSSTKERDESIRLTISKMEGFKNIVFKFPVLSIKQDFMVFTFILREFYKNIDNGSIDP